MQEKESSFEGSNRKECSRRVLVEICANPVLEICFDLLEMFCRKGGDRFGFIADVVIQELGVYEIAAGCDRFALLFAEVEMLRGVDIIALLMDDFAVDRVDHFAVGVHVAAAPIRSEGATVYSGVHEVVDDSVVFTLVFLGFFELEFKAVATIFLVLSDYCFVFSGDHANYSINKLFDGGFSQGEDHHQLGVFSELINGTLAFNFENWVLIVVSEGILLFFRQEFVDACIEILELHRGQEDAVSSWRGKQHACEGIVVDSLVHS